MVDVAYFTFNGLSFAIKECDFVLIGAYSVKFNGNVQGKCGQSVVAKVAK